MVITANDPHRPPVGHSSISILVPRLSHGCAFQNKQIVQNNVLLYGFAIDKPTDASDHLISGTAIVVDNKLVVLYSQFLNWGPIGTRYEWTDDTHTEVNKITDVPGVFCMA